MEDMQVSLIQAINSSVHTDSEGSNTSSRCTERIHSYAAAMPIDNALVFIKAAAVAAESRALMTWAADQFRRCRLRPPYHFNRSKYQRLPGWHGDLSSTRFHHIERRTSQAVLNTTLRLTEWLHPARCVETVAKRPFRPGTSRRIPTFPSLPSMDCRDRSRLRHSLHLI